MGFNEEILSKLPAEDKYIINKIFDEIEEAFLENFGYNARISPKEAAKALKTFADVYKNESASKLQSNIRALLSGKKIGERLEEFNNEDAAATTINNAIRNQLAKRKLNRNKDEKAINIIKAAARRNYIQPQYNEMMEQDINRIKGIRDYENKLKHKRIQLTNEQQLQSAQNIQRFLRGKLGRKEMGKREYEKRVEDVIRERELEEANEAERVKRIRDYENKLKQKRIHLINEEKGINYERKLKQNRIKAEEEAIDKRINKILVERSRREYENQERNANEAAKNLQRVYKGHLGRKQATRKKLRIYLKIIHHQYLVILLYLN